jgi:hypothetical protein
MLPLVRPAERILRVARYMTAPLRYFF